MKHRISKIWGFVWSKPFLGAMGFALALWLYITLNAEFVTFVKLPLIVRVPSHRAIETSFPNNLSVKIRGTGWQIFNLKYFSSASKCEIDLANEKLSDTALILNRMDLMKNLQFTVSVEALDVTPSNLNLVMDKISEYSIVVKPDVEIVPDDGYMLVGDLIVKPDLINISGNEKVIRNITEWKTVHFKAEGLREPLFKVTPLVDSLSNIITLSQNTVKVIADIQKVSEIIATDIPITVIGGDMPDNHKIMPMRLSLTLRGGIDDIIGLNYDNISVTLNASEIKGDTTGIMVPKVDLPPNIKLLSISPQYLQHRVIRQ